MIWLTDGGPAGLYVAEGSARLHALSATHPRAPLSVPVKSIGNSFSLGERGD